VDPNYLREREANCPRIWSWKNPGLGVDALHGRRLVGVSGTAEAEYGSRSFSLNEFT